MKRGGFFPMLGLFNAGSSSGLAHDIIWNFCALIVAAISGILINVLFARWHAPEYLGIFYQVCCLLLFFSQLGCMGIHYSLLRHLPVESEATRGVCAASGF